MKKICLQLCLVFFATTAFSQVGHLMQGVGAFNMSMGGASTGQPLDISGALHWNPAAISAFDNKIVKLDVGMFNASPELSSTVPIVDPTTGMPTGQFLSGTTSDEKGVSIMPALALLWGEEDSKHTFGASVFGVSGFGVDFPESTTNPINFPQSMRGFGHIKSNYSLLQTSLTYAYDINDNFSVGIQPNFNYAKLELMPNPTADPTMAGYPSTNDASAFGWGAQIGLYYDFDNGLKAGLSYKTTQDLSDFHFNNEYLDGSLGSNKLAMDHPAILSLGLGYSKEMFDIALDYRMVDYENTDGFAETGWTSTGSVVGFGWKNVNVISLGFQYKGIEKVPLRLGYTYSSNPISEEVAFYNVPATAIIAHAIQLGFTYKATEAWSIDAVYHYGMSDGETAGPMNDPTLVQMYPPYGAVPGSEVSYKMTTSLIMVGVSYTLNVNAEE